MWHIIKIVVRFFMKLYANTPVREETRYPVSYRAHHVHEAKPQEHWNRIAAEYSKQRAFLDHCEEVESRAKEIKYAKEIREHEEILRKHHEMTLKEWRENNDAVENYFKKRKLNSYRIV